MKLIVSSPHGKEFKLSCDNCHNTSGWKVNPDSINFNHDITSMPLTGQHRSLSCRQCHLSLVFDEAQPVCSACHTDMHENTVGQECDRCHSTNSWIVTNINEIHRNSRFPLLGAHSLADCQDCHTSTQGTGIKAGYSFLRFDPLGIECYDCHIKDYQGATKPNHQAAGYSTNCLDCHSLTAYSWSGKGINHDFFPLVQGHKIDDCSKCHTGGNFSNTSPVCSSCHEADFASTSNPNHVSAGIPNTCSDCHSTLPGWAPASFPNHNQYYTLNGAHAGIAGECETCHKGNYNQTPNTCAGCHISDYNQTNNPPHNTVGFSTECNQCHNETAWVPSTLDHDNQYFPIYSGKHNSTWNLCSDCHTTPSDYTKFSCIDCHEHNQADMNDKHSDIQGYLYNSDACFACHPQGNSEGSFNHSTTAFPLTGAHIGADCSTCHTSGYSGTTSVCFDCHETAYNESLNPNHKIIGIPNTCSDCHTTQPGWSPATFPIHNQYYQLNGAHALISNECSSCHAGNYSNTANTCQGCHIDNYNQTTNPPHASAQFSTDCKSCHNETAWIPSTFDHSGTSFPLTGAHIGAECSACHTSGYAGTTSVCFDCHETAYNQSVNPNHNSIGIPNTCSDCHTTQPGWSPATFPIHNQYYQLNGAHALISNECSSCHDGNYINTPNTCQGCHLDDYNQTNNPPHASAQFPTDCQTCHGEVAWVPSTFDHDNQYFPIYSGKHNGEWNVCGDCHNNPSNYSVFTCIDCHEHNKTDTDEHHSGVSGYVYNSNACYSCHPNGNNKNPVYFNKNKID
jgi:hypothetical protein